MQIEYSLSDVNGIGYSMEEKLRNAGITSVAQLAEMSAEKLSKFKGFGLASAKKLIESAKELLYNNNEYANQLPGTAFQEQNALKSTKAPLEYQFNSETIHFPNNQKNPIFELQQKDLLIDQEDAFENTLNYSPKISYAKTVKDILDRELANADFIQSSKDLVNNESKKENYVNSSAQIVEENLGELTNENSDTNYEEFNYSGFNGEKLDKKEITILQQNVLNRFKSRSYHIIPGNTTLLRNISLDLGALAFKIIKINEFKSVILLFPIQISNLRGTLIVSEDFINYRAINHKIKLDNEFTVQLIDNYISKFVEIQYKVFQNIILGKSVFQYLKRLINGKLSIVKTKGNKALYIQSDKMQYIIIVDSLLVCSSEPALLEKSVSFPYQRITNLHFISYEMIDEFLQYEEKKYSLIETRYEDNMIIKHQKSLHKAISEARIFSIPFLLLGIALIFIIFLSEIQIITLFSRLGIAAICIYGIILGFSYLKFFRIQKEIIEEYHTPYFQIPRKLDETDLVIMNEEVSSEVMDQLVYECFGKIRNLPILNKIEQEKAKQVDLDLLIHQKNNDSQIKRNNKTIESKTEDDSFRKKMVSKYSQFLEE